MQLRTTGGQRSPPNVGENKDALFENDKSESCNHFKQLGIRIYNLEVSLGSGTMNTVNWFLIQLKI